MLQPVNVFKPVFQIFPEKAKLVLDLKCPLCKKDIHEEDYENEISKREYTISGLCQECQNKTFGE